MKLLGQVDRREFLRRGALTALALAVLDRTLATIGRSSVASAGVAVPPLDVNAALAGITVQPAGFLAVGADTKGAAVWSAPFGASGWSQSADASAFPQGASLAGVATIGDLAIAAGHISKVDRILSVVDETGKAVGLPILGSTPAIFSSPDGVNWSLEETAVAGVDYGAYTAVASADGGKSALAVGSPYREAGVEESFGLIAVSSEDGHVWKSTDLLGVMPPIEGAVTMVAQTATGALLGVAQSGPSRLYVTSDAGTGGPWQEIAGPSTESSYHAAGSFGKSLLLAGVDQLDVPHVWDWDGSTWQEVSSFSGAPPGSDVVGLAPLDGSLVGLASSTNSRTSTFEVVSDDVR